MNTRDIDREWFLRESQEAEDGIVHRPLNAENAFWHAVRTGDTEFVQRECKVHRFIDTGRGGVSAFSPETRW